MFGILALVFFLGGAAAEGRSLYGPDLPTLWTYPTEPSPAAKVADMVPVTLFFSASEIEAELVALSVTVEEFTGDTATFPAFFRPWENLGDNSSVRYYGEGCEGVPPLREAGGREAITEAYFCWALCHQKRNVSCASREFERAMASRCYCRGGPQPKCHPGMAQTLLDARRSQGQNGPEWRVTSAAPARILGSDPQGIAIETYLPKDALEMTFWADMTGAQGKGTIETDASTRPDLVGCSRPRLAPADDWAPTSEWEAEESGALCPEAEELRCEREPGLKAFLIGATVIALLLGPLTALGGINAWQRFWKCRRRRSNHVL